MASTVYSVPIDNLDNGVVYDNGKPAIELGENFAVLMLNGKSTRPDHAIVIKENNKFIVLYGNREGDHIVINNIQYPDGIVAEFKKPINVYKDDSFTTYMSDYNKTFDEMIDYAEKLSYRRSLEHGSKLDIINGEDFKKHALDDKPIEMTFINKANQILDTAGKHAVKDKFGFDFDTPKGDVKPNSAIALVREDGTEPAIAIGTKNKNQTFTAYAIKHKDGSLEVLDEPVSVITTNDSGMKNALKQTYPEYKTTDEFKTFLINKAVKHFPDNNQAEEISTTHNTPTPKNQVAPENTQTIPNQKETVSPVVEVARKNQVPKNELEKHGIKHKNKGAICHYDDNGNYVETPFVPRNKKQADVCTSAGG